MHTLLQLLHFKMLKLSRNDCPNSTDDHKRVQDEKKRIDFRSAISSLLWLLNTRPDISFAVGELSRFVSNPGPKHYIALKRVFRYLKGTVDYGILFRRSVQSRKNTLVTYTDSDWAGNVDDRKSTSGYVIKLNDNLFSSKTKSQGSTSLSSCEAETVAMGLGAQETVFLRSVLEELGHPQRSPTVLRSDNTGAIAFSKDGGNHSKLKHISLREHYLRELVKSGEIYPEYISTAENPADLFTKALGTVKFRQHRDALNIVSRCSLTAVEGAN